MRDKIAELGVHPALGPEGAGWGIEQNPQELAEFLEQIPPVQTVLEIGTGYKAGLARFMHEIMGWQVTSIDKNFPQYMPPGVHMIHGTSVDAYPMVAEQQFDLVIIDADHSYEAVKGDFDLYMPLGNVVMLHDIAGLRDCEGVAQFWHETAYTKAGKLRKGFYEAIAADEYRAGIGWWVK